MPSLSRKLLVITAVAALGLVTFVVLYGTKEPSGNAALDPCGASASTAERLKPLARGEIAALRTLAKPVAMPDVAFETPEGPRRMSDFRGKTILFNLWATWCVPCREEMPALNNLQAKSGSPDFEVLALNMDTRNPERVPKWLADNKIDALKLYTDVPGKAFQELRGSAKVIGLPTTFLVDARGCIVGEMAGAAKWDSDEAFALVKAATAR